MIHYDHELKSWVGLFEPLARGQKTHDFRVMDRDYQVGQTNWLREWEPTECIYTGREAFVKITYITSAKHNPCAFSPFALHPSMAVLSVQLLSSTFWPLSQEEDVFEKSPALETLKSWREKYLTNYPEKGDEIICY